MQYKYFEAMSLSLHKFKIFQLSDGFTLLSHLSDLEAPICLKFYLFDSNIAKVYCLKVYLFDSNIAKPFFFD